MLEEVLNETPLRGSNIPGLSSLLDEKEFTGVVIPEVMKQRMELTMKESKSRASVEAFLGEHFHGNVFFSRCRLNGHETRNRGPEKKAECNFLVVNEVANEVVAIVETESSAGAIFPNSWVKTLDLVNYLKDGEPHEFTCAPGPHGYFEKKPITVNKSFLFTEKTRIIYFVNTSIGTYGSPPLEGISYLGEFVQKETTGRVLKKALNLFIESKGESGSLFVKGMKEPWYQFNVENVGIGDDRSGAPYGEIVLGVKKEMSQILESFQQGVEIFDADGFEFDLRTFSLPLHNRGFLMYDVIVNTCFNHIVLVHHDKEDLVKLKRIFNTSLLKMSFIENFFRHSFDVDEAPIFFFSKKNYIL